MKMPNIPQKLSSTSFRNAVIDYWKYRIENDEKVHRDVVKCRNFLPFMLSLNLLSDVVRQVVKH